MKLVISVSGMIKMFLLAVLCVLTISGCGGQRWGKTRNYPIGTFSGTHGHPYRIGNMTF